ncbi:sugar phosphate nucleotidyltransferase [Paenibacillus sp. BAC0078]
MRLILLSGGAGKRLWPLSSTHRPKQFLPVLQHEGRQESMLQRVWRQISDAGLAEVSLFSASSGQRELIHGQIGKDAPIVEEPERRDTFPAIALAAAYLYSEAGCDPEEIVGVMPVDGYTDDSFFQTLSELPGVLESLSADMVLMGVAPGTPSSKFGYIVLQQAYERTGAYFVHSFVEKPAAAKAQKLIDEGALWNCGVFVFRLKYILSELRRRKLPVNYEQLRAMYSRLPRISFDIEIVERAEQIVAVPFQGEWKDIGTWNSLSEVMENQVSGNGYVSPLSVDSHIINELDIPVSIWNVPDIVVAAGPGGILVTDREASTDIKEMVAKVEIASRFEERWWGRETVLSRKQANAGGAVTNRIVISAGCFLSYHEHTLRKEVWTVIDGAGEACLNGVKFSVEAGSVIIVELGMKHSILAYSELEMIESRIGKEISDHDIVHYDNPWGREDMETKEYMR